MKITFIDGSIYESHEKDKSNSTILINHFLKGYNSYDNNIFDSNYLADNQKNSKHIESFVKTDVALIIFPLYTDAMPG
jgi:hypothetical protein